jgi:hypothetical protein
MADEPTDAELSATDTDGAADSTATTGQQQTGTADLGDAGKRALAEERRARKAAEKELDTLRKAAMSDQEKAIAEAKTQALAEANKAAAPRLVRAEFKAAAAGKVAKEALDAYLEDVDLSKFVGDDGEPDTKAIEARIKRLGGGQSADFDGGARGGAARPQDMSTLIRQKAGVL